ncbi:MAG: sulfite exporter TauE/SafE family protein [Actinomycetia bacterium]|nr:sulfite exporter TauE/SafE family protein [Actinomycetes bacterium]
MILPFDPTVGAMALATVAALIVGISKTSVGGLGAVAVALFANLMPAKESTAAILLLLIIGDLVAVRTYYADTDWRMLRRLLPAVLPGIVLGALFLRVVPEASMRTALGLILLVMVSLQLWQRRRRSASTGEHQLHPGYAVLTGVGAGFATMAANSAGPVMAMYLLAARVDKARFIGTSAWYFMLVNLSKVPFSAFLGLYHVSTLWLTLVLLPVVLLGTWLGRLLVHRLSQTSFERFTLVASTLAAVSLLVPR